MTFPLIIKIYTFVMVSFVECYDFVRLVL